MRGLRSWTDSRRARSHASGSLCLALILVAANIIAGRAFAGAARSDGGAALYAVAPAPVQTLARIDEPITLRFYYSPRLGQAIPAYGGLRPAGARAARPVCRCVGRQAAPRNLPAAAVLRRSRTAPSPSGCRACRSMRRASRSISASPAPTRPTTSRSSRSSPPERERFLEYDLTRLVHTLAVSETDRRRAAQLAAARRRSCCRAAGPSGPAAAVLQQLRQLDDVETLPAALDAIPPGTDVLMLVHPQNLPEKTLYAIDQFVLRGGKAIVFVDPYSELAARGGRARQPRPTAISPGCSRRGASGCCRIPSPPTGATPGGSACRPRSGRQRGDGLRRLAQPARRRAEPRRCDHRQSAARSRWRPPASSSRSPAPRQSWSR